jgi:hypothetical protein
MAANVFALTAGAWHIVEYVYSIFENRYAIRQSQESGLRDVNGKS